MSQFHPDNHGIGIVHIGPGAFHRAHQAVYTQDAMQASGGDWRIEGVSLRSSAVADALNAQNGRYTLVIRDGSSTQFRQIDSIAGAIAASQGMDAVHAALVRPETRIISLTVTEKAYLYSSDAGNETLIPILVKALNARREAGAPAPTLMSCDNLNQNGTVLRRSILECASEFSAELDDWIAGEVRFPSTMVDRITPATTAELIDEVAAETGWADQIPVETEPFSQWVIEDNFSMGRPDWEAAGALMVSDVLPYEHMKLRMLNGAHSMLAYTGYLAGKKYVRDVMADANLATLVERHMNAASATLSQPDGLDLADYRDAVLARFRNPRIAHETSQIAMDGSKKMRQRIFDAAQTAAERSQEIRPFAFAAAAWVRYLSGETDEGVRYELKDPRADEFSNLPSEPSSRIDALMTLPDLVPPELAAHADFKAQTTSSLKVMCEKGIAAAIDGEVNG